MKADSGCPSGFRKNGEKIASCPCHRPTVVPSRRPGLRACLKRMPGCTVPQASCLLLHIGVNGREGGILASGLRTDRTWLCGEFENLDLGSVPGGGFGSFEQLLPGFLAEVILCSFSHTSAGTALTMTMQPSRCNVTVTSPGTVFPCLQIRQVIDACRAGRAVFGRLCPFCRRGRGFRRSRSRRVFGCLFRRNSSWWDSCRRCRSGGRFFRTD